METLKSDFFRYLKQETAEEVNHLIRYFERVTLVAPVDKHNRTFFGLLKHDNKVIAESIDEVLSNQTTDSREVYLLNANFNFDLDIQGTLLNLHQKMNRHSRVVALVYNSYFSGLYKFFTKLGLRKGLLPQTFVTQVDLENIVKLSGFEISRVRTLGYFPFKWFGLGSIINRILRIVPFVRGFSSVWAVTLRPVKTLQKEPSLTVVIPARNEKGNIENALKRMPKFPGGLEVIFIEGHSNDNTWEEIERVCDQYKNDFKLKKAKQTGKGKADAVRLGFSMAENDLLTILDADLTMPPEMLTRFYNAYTASQADFVNGTRLVYPMEGEAMRFLNLLGNKFFARALSYVLDTRLADSLCGTKLVTRKDYARFINWRNDFGDFDPFGDFELIFPACDLGLGVVDIPIHYKARTYGSTNISRFRHGFMLLRMTMIGLLKIKLR